MREKGGEKSMIEARNFLQALLLQNQRVKEARERLQESEQESGVHSAGFAERVGGGSGAASLIERIAEKREAVYWEYVKELEKVLKMRDIADKLFESLPMEAHAIMEMRYIVGMKWEEIAGTLNLSREGTRLKHRKIMDDVFHGVMVDYKG